MSDMSGMFASPTPDEATLARSTMAAQPIEEQPNKLAPVKENENLLRNPTKPGEFRKTNYDPFNRETYGRKSSTGSIGEVKPVGVSPS